MSDKKPQQGEFCWNELMTPDVKKAKEFYGALFGWKSQDHEMEQMTYTLFTQGEKEIGGMLQTPKGQEKQIPPHWMSYISVENLDGMLATASKLGATVTMPATAAGDFGRFAIIVDPTGAHVALWQALKTA